MPLYFDPFKSGTRAVPNKALRQRVSCVCTFLKQFQSYRFLRRTSRFFIYGTDYGDKGSRGKGGTDFVRETTVWPKVGCKHGLGKGTDPRSSRTRVTKETHALPPASAARRREAGCACARVAGKWSTEGRGRS